VIRLQTDYQVNNSEATKFYKFLEICLVSASPSTIALLFRAGYHIEPVRHERRICPLHHSRSVIYRPWLGYARFTGSAGYLPV
jgi:hypothetical protein